MFIPIDCHSERHAIGGDGRLYYAKFEDVAGELSEKYGGSARVVYIDPPFGTGGMFEYRRGKKQLAYTDSLTGDGYRRLITEACKTAYALLAEDGTFFLHIDYHMNHICRSVCNEIFGEKAFTNELIWAYKSGGRSVKSFSKKHDTILMYRKNPNAYFNIAAVGVPRGAARRNHMKRCFDTDGRVYYAIRSNGKEYRYYEDDLVYPSDVWDDIEHLHQRDPERTGFTTQKPEALLKRIMLACSQKGDTVIDLFGGSGTTASVAAKLGRRFVSVDCGAVSLAVTRRRLLENCTLTGIFSQQQPLDIEYGRARPNFPIDPYKYFTVEEGDGGAWLRPRYFDKNAAPVFAAVGSLNGGTFIAGSYVLGYKSGARLFIKESEILHIEDGDCNAAFLQYRGGK